MKKYLRKLSALVFISCIAASIGLSGCNNINADMEGQKTTDENSGTAGLKAAEEQETGPVNTGTADPNSAKGEETASDNAKGASKDDEVTEIAEKSKLSVVLSEESGVYDEEFTLELTCDGDADIYYTTDGSNPVTSSTRLLYTAPVKVADRSKEENYVSAADPFLFDAANVKVNSARDGFVSTLNSTPSKEAVDKCTVIRAAALDRKGLYTKAETGTYFIGSMTDHIRGLQESCEASGTNLAVISISIDYEDLFDPVKGIYIKGEVYDNALKEFLTAGEPLKADTSRQLEANYTQRGKEWERKVHMDFFESDGTRTTLALQQDCGIRIQGNYSRSDLQKGFRLFARKEYGEKNFEYPIFGEALKDDTGATIDKFKTLMLRNGGNCAFTTKFSDTYWQSLIGDKACDTLTSRPCIVYINGEYWGLYVLQEDYSEEYFEYAHGVNKDDVVLYKGDAEKYEIGYKLDLGNFPEGVMEEDYYFKELITFFNTHEDLTEAEDYEAFAGLVDIRSARDYYAVQIWINNKWDWPGKNWSLWRTVKVDDSNPYADGRWRFCFYDVEFGGVSGASDAYSNTIKEDNYKPYGLLDMSTTNPAVLIYAYLMTNESFRKDFAESLLALSDSNFKRDTALAALDTFKAIYSPLFDQFFARYPGAGSVDNSINGGYASYRCIKDFLNLRAEHIQPMLDYVNQVYGVK